MRPAHWLPPVAWMAVMFWISTDVGSGEHTSRILLPLLRWLLPWATPAGLDTVHWYVRKSAHVTEYAILAVLWFRAFRRGRNLAPPAAAWSAFLISAGWAALDEWHQSFVPSRTASVTDALLDSAGAAVAARIAVQGWRAALDAATTALLWLAAVGGAAALALDRWAGASSGALWLSTPTAVLLLLARWMLARRRPRPTSDAPGSGRAGGRAALRDP